VGSPDLSYSAFSCFARYKWSIALSPFPPLFHLPPSRSTKSHDLHQRAQHSPTKSVCTKDESSESQDTKRELLDLHDQLSIEPRKVNRNPTPSQPGQQRPTSRTLSEGFPIPHHLVERTPDRVRTLACLPFSLPCPTLPYLAEPWDRYLAGRV
jgi:hypothetical protein